MLETAKAYDRIFDVTQLAQSHQLKELAHKDNKKALQLAVKQFETFFLDSLMSSMRKASKSLGESKYFDSSEIDTFQEMLDQQMSQDIARGKGLGIADMLLNAI